LKARRVLDSKLISYQFSWSIREFASLTLGGRWGNMVTAKAISRRFSKELVSIIKKEDIA
jgi:hypothetical protein